MFKEFRAFIMRGNVLDLAVGVMVGGAFQRIVTSFVDDILSPVIGIFTAGIQLGDLSVTLGSAVVENGVTVQEASVFRYGGFIQSIIDFLIIAFCIFVLVKAVNAARQRLDKNEAQEAEKEKGPEPPTKEIELLGEIRDLLKKNSVIE